MLLGTVSKAGPLEQVFRVLWSHLAGEIQGTANLGSRPSCSEINESLKLPSDSRTESWQGARELNCHIQKKACSSALL